jgi:hypothetical protein
MDKKMEEHAFSIEMKSEDSVRRMSLFDKENGHVFFEGSLGKLQSVVMVECVMLEISGVNGALKLDITQAEMEKCLLPNKTNGHGGEQH